tara:strand:+ start:59 stop:1072 length:1014 start_codon:yes stop_codon:yes gene_type:complete
MSKKSFLVTGVGGFIGAAFTKKLLKNGENVIGIDNMNSYYESSLKFSRLKELQKIANQTKSSFKFYQFSIEQNSAIEKNFYDRKIDIIVHLAAQAGVRYSLENPNSYIQSNLVGFANILELARKLKVSNFIFASSSSVYGDNKLIPFKEEHIVDYPVSLYAATKKSNEVMAYSYSHLYGIPTTGLRFFTVYGPYGRPDMAPMIFLKAIMNNDPINIFNNGKMKRDFTFIDDIVEGLIRCCNKPAMKLENNFLKTSSAPFRIFNIGNGNPINLMDFIEILEEKTKLKARKIYLPMQKGDVSETFASTEKLKEWVNYSPSTSIEIGVEKFVNWYKDFYL